MIVRIMSSVAYGVGGVLLVAVGVLGAGIKGGLMRTAFVFLGIALVVEAFKPPTKGG